MAQMTLGELIAALDCADSDAAVRYDFVYMAPTTCASYRGFYDQLALGYGTDEPIANVVLAELRGAVGRQFQGWKGGLYTMGERTPMWVANPGEAGSTAIVGVRDVGWQVVIETGFRE